MPEENTGYTGMRQWLEKLRWAVSRFMYGRNGQDRLARASYFAGIILYLIGMLAGNGIVLIVSLLILCYGVFRILSKNTAKRAAENARFCEMTRKPTRYLNMLKMQWENRHTHRYFMCPKCGQITRVPKGKRKIQITCPKCGCVFVRRS